MTSRVRNVRDRLGCVETMVRVGGLWCIFLAASFGLKVTAPALSLDVKPVTPLKLGVALLILFGSFRASSWVARRFMGILESRLAIQEGSGEDSGGQ